MKFQTNSKFLMVHYAPGSAGKFLASLLMSSPSLSHFDPHVEKNKTDRACVKYIETRFSSDINQWVRYEPNHVEAWNLHFISPKFPRGDNLTIQQFNELAEEHATDHFFQSVNQGKIIPSVWHKTNTPEYLLDSLFVTIIIDPGSMKWYHRALWHKLYGIKNQKIHLKANDPDLNPAMTQYFKKFNNPVYSEEKFFTFVKQNILKNEFKLKFLNSDNFKLSCSQSFVALSDLLRVDSCIESITRITKELDIAPVPVDIITNGHRHWVSCHNFKYNSTYE
jgi:hypothetical protein